MQIIRIIKKFKAVMSSHQKIRVVELAFLMVIGGFLEMFSVSLMIPFMNAAINPDEAMKKWYVKSFCELFGIQSPNIFLVALSFLLAVLYILKNIYLLFEFNIQYRFVYGNMFLMQSQILNNFLHRPYEYYLGVNSGEIIRIVNSDTKEAFNLLSTLLSLLTELVVTGILIATIFVITPVVTLCIAVVLVILVVIVNSFLKSLLRRVGLENQKASAGMYKWLIQSIQGIKELIVMQKENYFQKNFDNYGARLVQTICKNSVYGAVPRFTIEAVSMSTMFVVMGVLIYNGQELDVMIPILTAVGMAAIRLLPSINRISSALASISFSEPMLDKMIENLNEIQSGGEISLAKMGNLAADEEIKERILGTLHNQIELKNIEYRYPTGKSFVLNQANMVIRAGESVGIVGPSGAGKTTTVDIILGLLTPQKGQVLVDGIDISEDMPGWLSQIGYIPQMIFMLDDSIRANVAFGIEEKDISDEAVWSALHEASLDEFVKELPDGLDTELGERGVRLSGGQRQRIGIARALYTNPSVLVFDEATSALDNETEAAIMESINRLQGKKTMIIIAHRLTTIEKCDRIIRVTEGKIDEEVK